MKRNQLLPLAFLLFTSGTFAQSDLPTSGDIPTFRVEAKSAFVWGEESAESVISSVVRDPLTGDEIHRLSHAGIEISSRMGYERVSLSEAGKLLNYTTTVANNTNSDLLVQYGGASVDGRAALPLRVALNRKGLNKSDRKDLWELSKMHCFKTGFASSDNVFSAHAPSKTFTVRPATALTISAVTKDPRRSSVLCSVDGCHVTGTIRYYIRVNSRDYVFVWPGRSVVYCGE